jgi:hypothetical protein
MEYILGLGSEEHVRNLNLSLAALESIDRPRQSDILKLISTHERLKKVVQDLTKASETHQELLADLAIQKSSLLSMKTFATRLVKTYFELQEKQSTHDALAAIEKGDRNAFGHAVKDLRELNEGTGRVAYANKWITSDQRPWHIYEATQELKKKFSQVNYPIYLSQWDSDWAD